MSDYKKKVDSVDTQSSLVDLLPKILDVRGNVESIQAGRIIVSKRIAQVAEPDIAPSLLESAKVGSLGGPTEEKASLLTNLFGSAVWEDDSDAVPMKRCV